jgi:DNA segregation ATPase FtsK/SpoIIIE-like protein
MSTPDIKEQYRQKWESIAVDTTPTDEQLATMHINEVYKAYNLPQPYILFVENPLYAARIAAYAALPQFAPTKTANGTDFHVQEVLDFAKQELHKEKSKYPVDFQGYGQLDAYWLVYWDYSINEKPSEVKSSDLAKIKPLIEVAKQVNYYWFFEPLAIVSRKPKIFAVEDKQLHNTQGPAIVFDDLEIYCLENQQVSKEEFFEKTAHLHSSLGKLAFKKI